MKGKQNKMTTTNAKDKWGPNVSTCLFVKQHCSEGSRHPCLNGAYLKPLNLF
jgi:hypothetical protein